MRNSHFDDEFALSNSIQHRESGRMLPTLVQPASREELSNLPGNWLFDWVKEASKYPVFKLVTVEEPATIEGLMSLEKSQGYYFVPLIENAPRNKGKSKYFRGVPGNLFAYACKLSKERGFDGIVAFDAKSELKEHYRQTLGVQSIGNSNRMFFDEKQAYELIQFHFNQQ